MPRTLMVLLTFVIAPSLATAGTVLGPSYPAPGGNAFSGSGMGAPFAGGRTFTLTGFDLSASDELWYGASTDFLPEMGVNGLNPMTFDSGASNFAGGVSVWTSTVAIPLTTGTSNFDARFTLTITDLADAPVALINSNTLMGFPGGEEMGLYKVTDPAGFKAHLLFEIDPGSGFDAALPVYDALSTIPGNSLDTSIGTGFYWTEAIPEPTSAMTFGMIMVAGFARRKRNRK